MRDVIWIAALTFISAGCAPYSAQQAEPVTAAPATVVTATAQPDVQAIDHETLAFVQAACGGCHSVETTDLSPNPQAPRWVDIANRTGLSEDTLSSWLRDAHNYPEMMDFDLDGDQVDMIAAYMLTLRSPDYKRAPD
ncbi:hypothetical protein IM511_08175 [Erythrobacteraceae bacterium E2-1 Yellow Sea]|nr:hypothetical protein [Erythrobacteraceae bacterium E2-1 Yellow Sea]